MKVFIDTEFTKFNGNLISLALATAFNRNFYGVLPVSRIECDPWVRENVLPVIEAPGFYPNSYRSMTEMAYGIQDFFLQLRKDVGDDLRVELIADWPEDLAWFYRVICSLGGGNRVWVPPMTGVFMPNLNCDLAEVRHNALSDAKALRDQYLGLFGSAA